jgi:hypothetical protein
VALLSLPACHRPGPPSAAYAHARARFTALYADELDDAYLDPQMADVEAELHTLPPDSVSHPDAQALLERIAKGREEAQKAREQLQQAVDEALAPPVMTGGALETDAAPPDAGPEAGTPAYPAAGMSLSDFQKDFGSCFHPAGQAKVGDAGTPATLYALVDAPDCQKRFAYFQSRLVVADSSKVLGKALKSAYRPPPDAGSSPDASGPAAPAAPAADAGAPPADAGAAPAR